MCHTCVSLKYNVSSCTSMKVTFTLMCTCTRWIALLTLHTHSPTCTLKLQELSL